LTNGKAQYQGGGINIVFGTVALENNTVSGNSGSPGGIYNWYSSVASLGNRGSFSSRGHNLIGHDEDLTGDGNGDSGLTEGQNGDRVGTSASPLDPRLGPLQDNGGPTKTHALLGDSPAIDAGDRQGPQERHQDTGGGHAELSGG
jgi:hypothetical protein